MRIYIDSWNAGFGELLSQADRTVTPELVERWIHDLGQPVPHRWWVAERVGSIVGVVGIGPNRDPVDSELGELDTIAVDPPHWRTGIGKTLISLALKHLVSDGYSEAILWTVEGYERGIASTRRWGGGDTAESGTKDDRSASGETWLCSAEAEAADHPATRVIAGRRVSYSPAAGTKTVSRFETGGLTDNPWGDWPCKA